ncbi:hypothetical protein EJ05DRAFT_130219 [Pseudovirgaria hyperparasitica]|uniref:GST C-terminal domain-containing protein n=1 Tax=Pseudovirgaria hyperparasitica TaxID=470096 RepID=A0A6A6VYF0_9PEZI|nr:uncharacterized protein EJ05DRAFT_130219 [Pseudovirgaria hyperparasitica]KAF2754690.1 hypothetical protein EJ05DRAFT_130219 [Pseudovirgaria hyperparasitica]
MEQTTIPTLHHMVSSNSFPVLVTLEEASALRPDGLKYDIVHYRRPRGRAPPELKQVHPLGKSPVMVVRQADGSGTPETMIESRLLIEYILDEYTNGELDPPEEDKRRANFWSEFMLRSLMGKVIILIPWLMIPRVMPFGLRHLLQLLFAPLVKILAQDLHQFYQFTNDGLSDERPWFNGRNFGAADLKTFFVLDLCEQQGVLWKPKKYPRLASWHAAVKERDAYKRALEIGGTYDMSMIE